MSQGVKYFNPNASPEFNNTLRGIYPDLLAETTVKDTQLIGIKQSSINSVGDPIFAKSPDFGLFTRQGKSQVVVSLLPPHIRERAAEDRALGFIAFRQIKDDTGKIETVHEMTDAYFRSSSEEFGLDIDLQNQGQLVTLMHFGVKRLSPASFIQLRKLPKMGEVHKNNLLETAIRIGLANKVKKHNGSDLYLASHPIDRDSFIEILEDRYPFLADYVRLGVQSDEEIPQFDIEDPTSDNVIDFAEYKSRREDRKTSGTSSQT